MAKRKSKLTAKVTKSPSGRAPGELAMLAGQAWTKRNWQGPAAPAPQAAAPSPAAAPAPQAAAPASPFLTPEQQMQADDALFQLNDGIYNLNRGVDDLEANTKYEIANTDKREQASHAAAVENMIARGLFRSSIKDAELADITASANARREYLATTLNTARIDRDIRVKKINDRKLELFGTGGTTELGDGGTYDQIAVQNAQAIEPVLPTTPGVDIGTPPAAGPAPEQKTVAIDPKAQQAAAASYANKTATDEASAARAKSQSANTKRARKPTLMAQSNKRTVSGTAAWR